MSLAGLVAFAVGAGVEPLSAALAAAALLLGWFRQPDPALSRRLEQVWLPVAGILVIRALIHVFVIRDDVVVPVVDLLLLLMAAEALRSLDYPNDLRLYALSFALLLASTAYRPGVVFLLAFVAYVSLATFTLMVGHLRRSAEAHRIAHVPLGRSLVRTTAGLSGVILLLSLAVFLTFPRVSRGWAGRGDTMATSIAGFSDEVSFGEHGSRIYPNPRIVLRVEFPEAGQPEFLGFHWRGRSYDHFDGVRWSRSRSLPPALAPTSWYRERWSTPLIRQRIYAAPLDVRVIFALPPALDVEMENGMQALYDNAGDLVYWGSGAPAYSVVSRLGTPSPDALRRSARGFRPSARHFLQLPPLDPRIQALADSLAATADNRYDRVMAVQRFLKSFAYTLELPRTSREATLEYFLFQRRAGHCEYFSTAMVVLLRAAGIEARNVNGFLGGEWNQFGNYLAVTQNQAHSWVEVWFPGYGWVTFDPTPAGAGGGSVEEAWFWPGRIFFDGLQHRWNKWVLDYSVDSQLGILRRWSGAFQESERRGGGEESRSGPWGRAAAILGLLVLVAVAARRALRPSSKVPPHTRVYLRLRERCRRARLEVPPGLTPLALMERIRSERPAAAEPATRLIRRYLAARYGGRTPGPDDIAEMQTLLRSAARALGR